MGQLIASLHRKFAGIKSANVVVIAPSAIPGLRATRGFGFEIEQHEATDDI